MSDYASLKVVDLKKVLKERSLPVSGNKADLIKRLEDADRAADANAESAQPQPESEAELESAPAPIALDDQREDNASFEQSQEAKEVAVVTIEEPISKPQASVQLEEVGDNHANVAEPLSDLGAASAQQIYETSVDVQNTTDQKSALVSADMPQEEGLSRSVDAKIAAAATLQTANDMIQNCGIPNDTQSMPRERSSEGLKSGQTRRRKRSRTPAPDESEVHKKLKSAHGEVKITLPEDVGQSTTSGNKQGDRSISQIPQEDIQKEDATHKKLDGDGEAAMTDPLVETGALETEQPHEKEQVNDAGRDKAMEDADESIPTRQDIVPAQHRTTNVLYIRNLKRPLNPTTLRKHLATVGGATDQEAQEIVPGFFIDPLRTHCFAKFALTEQASRARDGLHDQAWPDGRSKEKLWVDFIPEDRFDEWVKIEEESKGHKRWKVTYQTENGDCIVKLIDASDTTSKRDEGPSKAPATAPQSPRSKPKASPRDDRARGFKTLDDLFRSTIAKPKLYFLPVEKETVQKRLDALAKGRGGGRRDGHARFTFEDGYKLVDDGPDTGLKLDRPRGFVGGQTKLPPRSDRRQYDNRR